jgi:photosystem II stability/assembly factor-like uncharacterized protein
MKNSVLLMFLPLVTTLFACEGTSDTDWLKPGSWLLVRQADSTKFYHEICFVDQLNGWVVGDTGRVIHTSDAGDSWEIQLTGTTASLRSVQFRDANTGWACGENAIGMTTDGGHSWRWQYLPADSLQGFLCLFFASQSMGWMGDNLGGILRTEDGGINWGAQTTGVSRAITSIQFLDPLEGWAISIGGAVLHTTNSGANWTITTLTGLDCGNSRVGTPEDVFFCDRSTGWIATDVSMSSIANPLAAIPHTTNGGNTWICQSSPDFRISSIHFINENLGWAVAGRGILRTTDGGSNWLYEFELPTYRLIDLSIVDQSHGWALTYMGDVYKYVRQ